MAPASGRVLLRVAGSALGLLQAAFCEETQAGSPCAYMRRAAGAVRVCSMTSPQPGAMMGGDGTYETCWTKLSEPVLKEDSGTLPFLSALLQQAQKDTHAIYSLISGY